MVLVVLPPPLLWRRESCDGVIRGGGCKRDPDSPHCIAAFVVVVVVVVVVKEVAAAHAWRITLGEDELNDPER